MRTTSLAGIALSSLIWSATVQAVPLSMDDHGTKAVFTPTPSLQDDLTNNPTPIVVLNSSPAPQPKAITAPVPSAASSSLIGLGILGIIYVFHQRRKHRI